MLSHFNNGTRQVNNIRKFQEGTICDSNNFF